MKSKAFISKRGAKFPPAEVLASIEKIESISDIPGSDNLQMAKLSGLGIEVVNEAGEFKSKDTCLYIRPGTIVPKLDAFKELKDFNYRVKARRMKGRISNGICYDIKFIEKVFGKKIIHTPPGSYLHSNGWCWKRGCDGESPNLIYKLTPLTVGTDVTELIGARKVQVSHKKSRVKIPSLGPRVHRTVEEFYADPNIQQWKKDEVKSLLEQDAFEKK